MIRGDASAKLDRLEERWAAKPAVAAPPRDEGDAVALAEALRAAIVRAFPPEGKELALALGMVEDTRPMKTGSLPRAPTRVLDLVRAMYPPGPAPTPADMKAHREQLAALLDDLEDLLAGLSIAAASRGGRAGLAPRAG